MLTTTVRLDMWRQHETRSDYDWHGSLELAGTLALLLPLTALPWRSGGLLWWSGGPAADEEVALQPPLTTEAASKQGLPPERCFWPSIQLYQL